MSDYEWNILLLNSPTQMLADTSIVEIAFLFWFVGQNSYQASHMHAYPPIFFKKVEFSVRYACMDSVLEYRFSIRSTNQYISSHSVEAEACTWRQGGQLCGGPLQLSTFQGLCSRPTLRHVYMRPTTRKRSGRAELNFLLRKRQSKFAILDFGCEALGARP